MSRSTSRVQEVPRLDICHDFLRSLGFLVRVARHSIDRLTKSAKQLISLVVWLHGRASVAAAANLEEGNVLFLDRAIVSYLLAPLPSKVNIVRRNVGKAVGGNRVVGFRMRYSRPRASQTRVCGVMSKCIVGPGARAAVKRRNRSSFSIARKFEQFYCSTACASALTSSPPNFRRSATSGRCPSFGL